MGGVKALSGSLIPVRVLVPVLVAAGPYGPWVVFGGAVLSKAQAAPFAPPRLTSGLRVGFGWLVAVLWILTAAVIGFVRGDGVALMPLSPGFLLLSPVVAVILWWLRLLDGLAIAVFVPSGDKFDTHIREGTIEHREEQG